MLIKTTFVIQDHYSKGSSGKHFDLRIKGKKSLASWAIPKRKFPEKGENLLAIKTSNHPLDWEKFENGIKDGYGRGSVRIYDKGECIIYRWSDLSILFDLKGDIVKGRFILVPFSSSNSNRNKSGWLLIRSK